MAAVGGQAGAGAVVMNPFIMADYEFDIPDGVVVLKLKGRRMPGDGSGQNTR